MEQIVLALNLKTMRQIPVFNSRGPCLPLKVLNFKTVPILCLI